MSKQKLSIQPGDSIQVQMAGSGAAERYQSLVIGFLEGASVLISTPRIKRNVILVREGASLVARSLSGSRVVAFSSRVVRVCTHPYSYLHLAWPGKVEEMVLRKAERAVVWLHVLVRNDSPQHGNEQAMPALLADVSTAGAMVVSGTVLGEVGDVLSIRMQFQVAGVDYEIDVPGAVRNVRELDKPEAENQRFHHGVQFGLLDQQASLALHGLVYEKLVKV